MREVTKTELKTLLQSLGAWANAARASITIPGGTELALVRPIPWPPLWGRDCQRRIRITIEDFQTALDSLTEQCAALNEVVDGFGPEPVVGQTDLWTNPCPPPGNA